MENFDTTIDSRFILALTWLFGCRSQIITGSDLLKETIQGKFGCHSVLIVGGNRANNLRFLSENSEEIAVPIKALDIEVNELGYVVNTPDLREIDWEQYQIFFICLGSPKQELFIQNYSACMAHDRALFSIGAGAAWDFITGRQRRAPQFISLLGFEWLFRAFTRKGHWIRIAKMLKVFRHI